MATLVINDPRGQKVMERKLRADSYGGIEDAFTLGDSATDTKQIEKPFEHISAGLTA